MFSSTAWGLSNGSNGHLRRVEFPIRRIGSYAELGASPEEDLENGLFADEWLGGFP